METTQRNLTNCRSISSVRSTREKHFRLYRNRIETCTRSVVSISWFCECFKMNANFLKFVRIWERTQPLFSCFVGQKKQAILSEEHFLSTFNVSNHCGCSESAMVQSFICVLFRQILHFVTLHRIETWLDHVVGHSGFPGHLRNTFERHNLLLFSE